jgi:hypothetical protein
MKELEDTLMPLPLLANPLTIVGTTTPAAKLKGSSILLTSTKSYVERNIKKRLALITKAWEISKNMVSFGSRVHAFHESLEVDMKMMKVFNLMLYYPLETEFPT